MPYRTFASGEVLTANNVMTFLANQTVISVTNAAGRPTSPTTGMLVYVQDVAQLQLYNGTTWVQVYPVVGDGIVNGTVGTNDLADGSVTTAKIADGNISNAKMVNGGTYSVNISGTAANASALAGYSADTAGTAGTVAVRDFASRLRCDQMVVTNSFQTDNGSWWVASYLNGTLFRVSVSNGIYYQPINGSFRTVYVNQTGDLGYLASSERFKENIKPLDVDSDKILEIEPVSFKYKEGGPDWGVIAEQVDEIGGFDHLLYRNAQGDIDGFAYEKLPVLLLKVCRDQQAQIDALTKRIEALEAR